MIIVTVVDGAFEFRMLRIFPQCDYQGEVVEKFVYGGGSRGTPGLSITAAGSPYSISPGVVSVQVGGGWIVGAAGGVDLQGNEFFEGAYMLSTTPGCSVSTYYTSAKTVWQNMKDFLWKYFEYAGRGSGFMPY